MKTAPKLQALVEQLAVQYCFDLQGTGDALALEQEAEVPWARLLIENLGAKRIKLSCQLYIFDEWVDEPAIVFWTAPTGDWAPIEVTQIQGGWQGYAALDPQGDLEDFYDPAGQATLAHFAEAELFVNLTTQGWLTNSRRVVRPAHWPGCQRKHAGPCYGLLWQCAACGKSVCCAEGTDDHPEVCDACWVKLYDTKEEVNDVPF
jgi:hypothetical protein